MLVKTRIGEWIQTSFPEKNGKVHLINRTYILTVRFLEAAQSCGSYESLLLFRIQLRPYKIDQKSLVNGLCSSANFSMVYKLLVGGDDDAYSWYIAFNITRKIIPNAAKFGRTLRRP